MENLLESNERTLVMFDAVCSGLASCLALVHSDIKQMTEHRNKLAQIETQQIQAKLIAPKHLSASICDQEEEDEQNNNHYHHHSALQTEVKSKQHRSSNKNLQDESGEANDGDDDSDPHHLARLKLLDKRLADSFSRALNLNDQQKSSIAAKQQANQNRTSIFHVLLGKYTNSSSSSNSSPDKKKKKNNNNIKQQDQISEQQLDNKMIIDDINRQTRLAMQYSKQLEANLFKVEDLRSKYEMHLKMGLVVKSVSRAYLNSESSSIESPNSLARRHHCSSLFINDSSSIGTNTHSSMSSLSMSTWSSSRFKSDKRRSVAAALSQAATNELRLNNGNGRSDMFVSTLSLSNSKQHNKRSPSKVISPSPTKVQPLLNNHESSAYPLENTSTLNRHSVISSQFTGQPATACKGHLHQSNQNQLHHHHHHHHQCTQCTAYSPAWTEAPEPLAYTVTNSFLNNSDTPKSKSNINLHASHSSLKGSKSKKQQQEASKTTIKEFIENINRIESEFESYMGSFLLAIEDIQGFARVCHGDVFEVSIKYGDSQKFKTKISILKDRQKCDNRQSVFKARIADMLAIKAYECKSLAKKVLLGHKLCETRDLFTAQSQLMTFSLNQTGSIKLNLIVTWNPLHLAPNPTTVSPDSDLTHISLPSASVSSSSMSSVYSVPSVNGTTTTINIKSAKQGHKPNNVTVITTDNRQQQQQQQHHQRQESMYQAVDPTYGYYLPPPDYHSNEIKYREA